MFEWIMVAIAVFGIVAGYCLKKSMDRQVWKRPPKRDKD